MPSDFSLIISTTVIIILLTISLSRRLRRAHESLQALLWMQSSGEYPAVTRQIFRSAQHALDVALADPTVTAAVEQTGDCSTLPPAIIVDVDETILDSSPFGAWLAKNHREYDPSDWDRWVKRADAQPVPGAADFLRYAANLGAALFYVTGRKESDLDATRLNLERCGFPVHDHKNAVSTVGEVRWENEKGGQRAAISKDYRIVMIIGDDLGDFVPVTADASPEERMRITDKYGEYWGTRWIMLPNPSYGGWEVALTGGAASRAKKIRAKFGRLKTME